LYQWYLRKETGSFGNSRSSFVHRACTESQFDPKRKRPGIPARKSPLYVVKIFGTARAFFLERVPAPPRGMVVAAARVARPDVYIAMSG
jgi:hypothetical protein